MKCFFSSTGFVFLNSCKTTSYIGVGNDKTIFKTVSIDTLFQDKISIRAISTDGNKIWFAANDSRFGYYDLKIKKKIERKITKDTLKLNLKYCSNYKKYLLLSVANPGLLYKVSKTGLKTHVSVSGK
jgi:hypothetical protein